MEITPEGEKQNMGFTGVLFGFKNEAMLEPRTYAGQSLLKFFATETLNIHCNLARQMIVADTKCTYSETNIIATFKLLTELF